jgi:uncharacterized repeat protein (TIGR03837 family)
LAEGLEVRRREDDTLDVTPADVCIEAFGCGLPERYVDAMARRSPHTLWIVLEYLSAEPWVREYNGLPSPHPRFPLQRYFYFPGFEAGTGGVLRESGLLERREAYGDAQRAAFWSRAGFAAPDASSHVVSVFAYPYAPLVELLNAWSHGTDRWVVAVPVGALATAAVAHLAAAAGPPGTIVRRGSLELRVLPFVPQERYDELLWACDCNFVRGEDSFVRGQWAQVPFVWHIYPQDEQAHWRKLEAFLDLYCGGLESAPAVAMKGFWRAWNQVEPASSTAGAAWGAFWTHRAVLAAHARAWALRLAAIGELAENLAEFCRDKLK